MFQDCNCLLNCFYNCYFKISSRYPTSPLSQHWCLLNVFFHSVVRKLNLGVFSNFFSILDILDIMRIHILLNIFFKQSFFLLHSSMWICMFSSFMGSPDNIFSKWETADSHCLAKDEWVSVQFSRSVMSNSLRPHGLQYARVPCPSPTP